VISCEGAEEFAAAIRDYSYPCCVFDFETGAEILLDCMLDVESFIRERLRSTDPNRVKDGLANVLYWGHYRAPGVRDTRVRNLRNGVDSKQLRRTVETFASLQGPAIRQLKKLDLPEFSNLSFLSKLRTFLDPHAYCVIDLKLRSIQAVKDRFKANSETKPTCIPVTKQNEQSYEWWVRVCGEATRIVSGDQPLRPVDAERGFFRLVEDDKACLAHSLIRRLCQR
jgi:hypothetical protein